MDQELGLGGFNEPSLVSEPVQLSFFGPIQRSFGLVFDNFARFFNSRHFSRIFCHLFEIIQNLQNKIK